MNSIEDKPIRIQRSRQHKQVSPNGLPIVYVGRPSRFANPFYIGLDGTPAEVLKKYYDRIIGSKGLIKELLRGKNLSCWCKIGEPCHADILIKIANQ